MKDENFESTTIAGLDETYTRNLDPEKVECPIVMLVDFLIDGSGSMSEYEGTMRECLVHYKSAIIDSKQADEILISKTIFETKVHEGGYAPIEDLNTDYTANRCTSLYDAIVKRHEAMLKYVEALKANGTNSHACMTILSDGEDTSSEHSINDAYKAVKDMISDEITVAFITFGEQARGIAESLGIKEKNIIEVSNDESELRRVMDLFSKSTISASKRVSSGAGIDDGVGFFDI